MSATLLRSEGSKPRLQAGGTLNPRRHLYIERPDDATLLQMLSEGQYVNVLTSRQMGKSSLMVRTAQALTDQGVRCAIVDLAAELGTPEDGTAYFLGLLNKIARDLKIKIDLSTWWAERADETLNQRLMRFFREVVLEQVPGPVVCFLDEIDSTLKLPWTDDLFTALRGMHNERPMVPAYERLTFCFIGVAWPNELIKDRRTTPYNVGSTLELRDFEPGRDDLTPLVDALGANSEQGERLIERVLYWTGGHPYLTARLCASLVEIGAQVPKDVDRRVDDSFRSLERVSGDVHFQQVLRFLETRVADGLATFGLYAKILKGARERDQPAPAHTELKLSGLVKRDEEGCLVLRNRIYERLFDRRWIENTRPRRALKTYRRYAIAAGTALLIGAVVAGGWIAYLQAQLNERQRLEALGISITSAENRDGTRITFPARASQEVLEQAVPLLKAVGPVTELHLSGTLVADLTPLANLKALESLDVGATAWSRVRRGRIDSNAPPISNFQPLSNLILLKRLVLKAGELSDLSFLADLRNLQSLDLSYTQVADLTPLANLTNLQSLDLSGTQVADAAPLANLRALKSLDVGATFSRWSGGARIDSDAPPISNFEALSHLILLESLDLDASELADLSFLADLTNLQSLNLSGTHAVDLAPLANLIKLHKLNLDSTQIADLTPLANLTKLQVLYLGNTQVADLAPLRDLTALRAIDLAQTKVTDFSPLLDLPAPETVGLYDSIRENSPSARPLLERGVGFSP